MAHKKAGGSTSYGRDSQGQRLGTKKFGGEHTQIGDVLVRQRGTPIRPGKNVKKGSDDTLYSVANGTVKFTTRRVRRFTGAFKHAKFVNVVPMEKKVTAGKK